MIGRANCCAPGCQLHHLPPTRVPGHPRVLPALLRSEHVHVSPRCATLPAPRGKWLVRSQEQGGLHLLKSAPVLLRRCFAQNPWLLFSLQPPTLVLVAPAERACQ